MSKLLINTAYLGNIAYWAAIAQSDEYQIELFENYQKQSFRNRTQILGANGVVDLLLPVIKQSGTKTAIKECKIDYSTQWQKIHFRSIMSAYKNSPYYEHYIDYLAPIFEKRENFLLDYNMLFHEAITKILRFKQNYSFTTEYIVEPSDCIDMRSALSNKKMVLDIQMEPYYQVFSEKMAFVPNLSVLDLIFCEGSNSSSYLTMVKL